MSSLLPLIIEYATRWGVEIRFEPASRGYNLYRGPTGETVIDWTTRSILVEPKAKSSDLLSMILHDIGHCLTEKDPNSEIETLNLILAFDWASHRYLKVPGWETWMDSFVITSNGDTWHEANPAVRQKVLKGSRDAAVKAGVLDSRGRPTFKRPAWCERPKLPKGRPQGWVLTADVKVGPH